MSAHQTQIFVNLPVKDLEKSKAFYAALGYTFNPQFTDQNAACVVISDTIYAMLLVEPFFRTFTKKEVADANHTVEAIIALSLESRGRVDEIVERGIAAGAVEPRERQDHGWMYGRSLHDPDGHLWEFFYMDPAGMAKGGER
jgi:predicted lactoylglutathione lyase